MASASVAAALAPAENNNPEKVVTSDHGPEQSSPTKLVGVATDTGKNTAPCLENIEKVSTGEFSKEESNPTGEESKPTGEESNPTGEESKPTGEESKSTGEEFTSQKTKPTTGESTSQESKPITEGSNPDSRESKSSGDMGNSDSSAEKKKRGVNIELGAKASDQNEPSNKQTSSPNISETSSEQSSAQKVHPSSPNQKGRNVQFENHGHGNSKVVCGPGMPGAPPGDDDDFSVDRPFVSTLGSQHDRRSQTVQPTTNGDLEEDGFRMRHHGRSFSERGSGMLRGRTSSMIANGTDDR
jgi:hypothetical protein